MNMKIVQKIFQVGIMIVGVLLIINAIAVGFFSNFNLGILATLFMGLLLAAHSLIFKKIERRWGYKVARFAKCFVLVGVAFFLCVVGFIASNGLNQKVTFEEDVVIVLGAGLSGDKISMTLKARLDQALYYMQQNPDVIIVVTGGQGPQEDITEAFAMKEYLLEAGVSQDAILLEDQSTSTVENLRFAKEILDKEFSKNYKVAVITNDFHTYRALVTAKQTGLDSVGFSAPSQWYMLPVFYTREFFAVLHVWLFGTGI
jgi:uncharacterized SAM-binding protein YcdF (DUF218 family)